MNIQDFNKGFQINKKFLDTIDFVPFLKEAPLLSVLRTAVKIYCFSNHIVLPPELDEDVFKYYNNKNLKEYLEKRYQEYVSIHPINDYMISFMED